jgi:hypothetical protein
VTVNPLRTKFENFLTANPFFMLCTPEAFENDFLEKFKVPDYSTKIVSLPHAATRCGRLNGATRGVSLHLFSWLILVVV